jgi:hypothetical protein
MGYAQIEASEHGPSDLRPPKYKFGGRSPTSELHRIHKYSSGTSWLIEHLAAYTLPLAYARSSSMKREALPLRSHL